MSLPRERERRGFTKNNTIQWKVVIKTKLNALAYLQRYPPHTPTYKLIRAGLRRVGLSEVEVRLLES